MMVSVGKTSKILLLWLHSHLSAAKRADIVFLWMKATEEGSFSKVNLVAFETSRGIVQLRVGIK